MSDQISSRFTLVQVASARAKQLLNGCTPKVDGSAKPARRAMQEVAAGLVQPVSTDGVEAEAQEV